MLDRDRQERKHICFIGGRSLRGNFNELYDWVLAYQYEKLDLRLSHGWLGYDNGILDYES